MRPIRLALILTLALALSAPVGPARGDDPSYFPLGVFRSPAGGDISGMVDVQFTDALRRMREPSLAAAARADPGLTAYRVLFFPSTYDDVVAVRVEWTAAGATGRRVAIIEGGNKPAEVVEDQPLTPTLADRDRIADLVRAADFAALPPAIDDLILESEWWLIEGVVQGRYHAVFRRSPEAGGFRSLARVLVKLGRPQPGTGATRTVVVIGSMILALSVLIAGAVLVHRRWPDVAYHRSRPHPSGDDPA